MSAYRSGAIVRWLRHPAASKTCTISQVAKDRARVVNLVRQRCPKDILIRRAQMSEIGFVPLLPVPFAPPLQCRRG
jgi:hypothetical protein